MDRLTANAIMKLQSGFPKETYKSKSYSVATNNRVIALVKGMCSLSAKLLDTTNHAIKVSLIPENNARTYYCKVKGNLIALLWLTGCRLTELTHRKWEDVDFDNRTLFIKTTKNGQTHQIYLSNLMVEL